MVEIYTLPPTVPATDPIETFLERSQKQGGVSIDVLLLAYETRLDTKGDVPLVELPLGVKYFSRDTDRHIVLARSMEYLNSVFYKPSDTEFTDPLGIAPLPDPWKRLAEYGLSCAEYCAARDFPTRIFLRKPPVNTGFGDLILRVSPGDVVEPEKTRIPLFLIA